MLTFLAFSIHIILRYTIVGEHSSFKIIEIPFSRCVLLSSVFDILCPAGADCSVYDFDNVLFLPSINDRNGRKQITTNYRSDGVTSRSRYIRMLKIGFSFKIRSRIVIMTPKVKSSGSSRLRAYAITNSAWTLVFLQYRDRKLRKKKTNVRVRIRSRSNNFLDIFR